MSDNEPAIRYEVAFKERTGYACIYLNGNRAVTWSEIDARVLAMRAVETYGNNPPIVILKEIAVVSLVTPPKVTYVIVDHKV